MYYSRDEMSTFNYIETPRSVSVPVKIDVILEERIKAFIKSRRVKRFTFTK